MSRFPFLFLSAVLVLPGAVALGDEDVDRDNPPIPGAEIRRVTISVFPNKVIVVKGKMVEIAELREHLKELVPDARKPAVEMILIPSSKREMGLVAKIIGIAKELGYTNISYVGPRKRKVLITDVRILISKTGDFLVNADLVENGKLRTHLEKLVKEERRQRVRIILTATRLVNKI